MLAALKHFCRNAQGATAIEYGLICAIIAMVLIITFNVGTALVTSLELLLPALR